MAPDKGGVGSRAVTWASSPRWNPHLYAGARDTLEHLNSTVAITWFRSNTVYVDPDPITLQLVFQSEHGKDFSWLTKTSFSVFLTKRAKHKY